MRSDVTGEDSMDDVTGENSMDNVLLLILSASFVAGAWLIYQVTP
jgi:hypothetical protein